MKESMSLPPSAKKMGEMGNASEANSMKPDLSLMKTNDKELSVMAKGGKRPEVNASIKSMANDTSIYA